MGDGDGADIRKVRCLGVAQIDGFDTQYFIGIRVYKGFARAVNLPLIAFVRGMFLTKPVSSLPQYHTAFACAYQCRSILQSAFFNDQRLY